MLLLEAGVSGLQNEMLSGRGAFIQAGEGGRGFLTLQRNGAADGPGALLLQGGEDERQLGADCLLEKELESQAGAFGGDFQHGM